MSTDPQDFIHPIDSPHPTRDNPQSSHEEAVEEARRLTVRLSCLLQIIGAGSPELVVPVIESDLGTAADNQGGFVPVRRRDPEWENFVLLKSINDSLLELRKLTRRNVV